MRRRGAVVVLVAGAVTGVSIAGCESLPKSGSSPGVSGGDATVTARPQLPQQSSPLLGPLTVGTTPAPTAYLVGAQADKTRGTARDRAEARQAIQTAGTHPAAVADVSRSSTADLNNDGFVTADEVIAMSRAGLSDDEILRRLEATGQVFDLTLVQRDDLVERGVSRRVVDQMNALNQPQRDEALRLRNQQPAVPR